MRNAGASGEGMPDDPEVVITTSLSPTDSAETMAQEMSRRLGLPYQPRGSRSLSEVIGSTAGAVVVESNGITVHVEGSALRFHPNMAKIRVMQLARGGRDRMVEVMRLSPRDAVLDCTCGLAADAVVASFVVGGSGLVHALEISPLLSQIVAIGLSTHEDPLCELVQAMRRVKVFNCAYGGFLRAAADDRYDVVYFDPMFEETLGDSKGLDVVRVLGSPGAPTSSDIAEAVRVARRLVVMKDSASETRLVELGFKVVSSGKRTCYGIIEV